MEKYKKIAFWGLCVALFLVLGWIFFKYVFEIILPFLVAFLIVAMARPMINSLAKRTKLPKPIIGMFIIFMMFLVSAFVIGIIGTITISQVANIVDGLIDSLSGETGYVNDFFQIIDSFEEKAPFLKSFLKEGQTLSSLISEMILDSAKNLSARFTEVIGRLISAIPNIAVTLIVVGLSIFYFAKDYDKIGNHVFNFLPKRVGNILLIFKNDVLHVVSKYLKAYLILFIICFAEVFSGFLIVNQKNAFVLAIIISVVDFLPILGAGTVLVPWGIVMLAIGDYKMGIALIILAGVTYFSRQILEPKILSVQMNMHPLLTLFAMFLGLKIAGFGGLVVAPIVAFIIKITHDRIKYQKNVEKTTDM